MASRSRTLAIGTALALLVSGCVSVYNHDGLQLPRAFCSCVRGTLGTPKGPVPIGAVKKTGSTGKSVIVKEWVFTGISVDVLDMTLQKAIRDGGLRTVHYADYDQTSYLGFVTLFSVTAYGE